jgi:adenosine kinase
MQYSNLVVTGSLAKDTIFNFPDLFSKSLLPENLSNLSVSFQTNNMTKSLGGPLLNIAHSLCNFRTDNVKLIGAVGKDGKEIIDFLQKTNLDIENVLIDENLFTATGSCITDAENNQIWGFCDGAGELLVGIDLSKICQQDSLLLLAPTNDKTVISYVNQAIEQGLDYVYDIGMHIPELAPADIQKGVQNCKYLIVNEYELEQIKSKIQFDQKAFLDGGKILIVTLGSKGVKYLDQIQEIFVPAYSANCVDPVGAGDAWRGAFFGELINGKDLIDCLVTANAMASIAVESHGGAGYTFDKTELQKRFDRIQKLK